MTESLTAIGWIINSARRARGWNVIDAAGVAEIAPKTWVRAEAGQSVRAESCRKLAVALGLPDGSILDAIQRDDGPDVLAEMLNVRSPNRTSAVLMSAPVLSFEPPPRTAELAGELVAELLRTHRSPAAQRVVTALLDWIPELVTG